MNWPAQGIHHGVPFATYRACDITQTDTIETVAGKSVSKSLITDFIPDPFAWKQSPPKKQTAAMKCGSLFDCLLTDTGPRARGRHETNFRMAKIWAPRPAVVIEIHGTGTPPLTAPGQSGVAGSC